MSEPIPTEAIRDVTSITDLVVSPDGETVAYLAKEYDGEADDAYSSLFTVPADGSEEPHRLTRVSDASSPTWGPNGRWLGFLAAREEDIDRRVGREERDEESEEETDADAADDEPETQVWAFDLERGGDARQVTDRDHGVREFDWGPDGDRIVISARDPTDAQEAYLEDREDDGPIEIERLQHKANGVGFTDDVTTYLFIVDVETGEERRLEEAFGAGAYEPIGGLDPAWHPSADEVAFLTCKAERPDDSAVSNLFTVDVDSGEVTRLTDMSYQLSLPDWSPTGDALVVSGRPADNWYHPGDVYLVDRKGGETTSLAPDLEATISWFGAPRFVGESSILGIFGDLGWSRWYRLDAGGDAPEPVGEELGRHRSTKFFDVNGGTVVYSIDDPTAGHDLYAASAGKLEALVERGTPLTAMNDGFVADHSLPNFRRLLTEHEAGTVESMLYYPDSFDPDSPDPHPLVVWTHGGPMSYDDPSFRFAFAYFSSRGYVICKPNYRGSTSYGREFAEALRGAWGTAEVADVLAVTDDLVDRGWADPDRLFPMGFSYGGITTGYLITRSNRWAAAAAEHGIYDLRSEFGTSDSQVWMSNEFGVPWEQADRYDAASAILDVGEVETPTLVTAGGQDWRCPPQQSEQLYVSIRKQGVPAKLVVYPNEHHNVGDPERAIHRLEAIASWFDRHDPATETAENGSDE